MKLFAPDSKFMIAMGRLADLIILNCIYLVTCIPLFTIGAAATAMYTVTFRLGTDRDEGVLKPYFRAFLQNFKQATVLWLLLALGLCCAGLDIFLFYRMEGLLRFLMVPCTIVLILMLLVCALGFPLLSQFDNTTKRTVLNAFLLSLAYLPRALLVAAMMVFPFVVFYYSAYLFFQTAFMWVFLYFSATAYFSALLLKPVFKRVTEPEEKDEETM